MASSPYLFVLQEAPYKNTVANEALDMILTLASFDASIQLVFKNEGIFQLLANQNVPIGVKAISKILASLHYYDIDNVYVCETELNTKKLSLEDFIEGVSIISLKQYQQFITHAKQVFIF